MLKAAVQGTAERVGVHWALPSEGGDVDVGTIWSKWSATLLPVEGREWITSEGTLKGDGVIAVDGNIHLAGGRQDHGRY